jgi:hypothetical protein
MKTEIEQLTKRLEVLAKLEKVKINIESYASEKRIEYQIKSTYKEDSSGKYYECQVISSKDNNSFSKACLLELSKIGFILRNYEIDGINSLEYYCYDL